MDREKLNKAAGEDWCNNVLERDLKPITKSAFKRGANWLMQQPLSERLTEEEKEKILNYHRVLTKDKHVAICNRSYSGQAGAVATLFSLEQIFGEALFKEK